MASVADERPLWARPAALFELLKPSPGRWEFACRQGLICALTALAVSLYRTPDAALTVYMVFFLNKPDRASSLLTNVVMMLLMSVIIAGVMLIAMIVVDQPIWRVASIASLSFILLFLASASKLRPIGSIVALISGYALDSLGTVHAGEVATRALLYAWLFAAIPAGLSIVVNLLIAPPPRRLAGRALAEQLGAGAKILRSQTPDEQARFQALRWRGAGEVSGWLKLAALEKTTSPRDLAALQHAATSTTAILLLVDLAVDSPDAALPQTVRLGLARMLDDMAKILRAGGHPEDVAAPSWSSDRDLSEIQRALLEELEATLVAFAEPSSPVPAPPAAKPKGGFFVADAFTNPEHVHYALKTTLAAMLCYGLYTTLHWPGIHTCFITCYIVSLATAGETTEKLALRVLGCLIGAAAGLAAIVFIVPSMTSVGSLMLLVFVSGFAAAWVAGGGPQIAYAGLQIAFALFICVIQGASPAFDLVSIRDRVIGILVGDVVAYLVFVNVWPVSVSRSIDGALGGLLNGLSALSNTPARAARRAAAPSLLADYHSLERTLGLSRYEPDRLRPSGAWLHDRALMLAQIPRLIAPLLVIGRERGGGFGPRLDAIADAMAPSSVGGGVHGPSVHAEQFSNSVEGQAMFRALADGPLTALEALVARGAEHKAASHD